MGLRPFRGHFISLLWTCRYILVKIIGGASWRGLYTTVFLHMKHVSRKLNCLSVKKNYRLSGHYLNFGKLSCSSTTRYLIFISKNVDYFTVFKFLYRLILNAKVIQFIRRLSDINYMHRAVIEAELWSKSTWWRYTGNWYIIERLEHGHFFSTRFE